MPRFSARRTLVYFTAAVTFSFLFVVMPKLDVVRAPNHHLPHLAIDQEPPDGGGGGPKQNLTKLLSDEADDSKVTDASRTTLSGDKKSDEFVNNNNINKPTSQGSGDAEASSSKNGVFLVSENSDEKSLQEIIESKNQANTDVADSKAKDGKAVEVVVAATEKPWFMQNGWLRPEPAMVDRATNQRIAKLWPHEQDSDRIVNQLMFVPPDYEGYRIRVETKSAPLKKILLHNGMNGWYGVPLGRDRFLQDKCPVDTCEITTDRNSADKADAILFRDTFRPLQHKRPPHQVWILYLLECPYHTHGFPREAYLNWTATYRHTSDVVAPYEKFVPYDENVLSKPQLFNWAQNKTKKVAWFVSNCNAQNRRLTYARELGKYIDVDIYGSCGKKTCSKGTKAQCFEMLKKEYKFYLSFENSNCRDYITEKFFINSLQYDVLPIVMGAHPEDYKRSAPHKSYIHVEEFDSPAELAQYLHKLDQNDTLYNQYFEWKDTGEMINTYFWCRLCAMLHDANMPRQVYKNVETWWRGSGVCTNQRWTPRSDGDKSWAFLS